MLIKVSETLFCSGTFLVVCLHIFLIHTCYIFSKRFFEKKAGRSCTIQIFYVTLQPE